MRRSRRRDFVEVGKSVAPGDTGADGRDASSRVSWDPEDGRAFPRPLPMALDGRDRGESALNMFLRRSDMVGIKKEGRQTLHVYSQAWNLNVSRDTQNHKNQMDGSQWNYRPDK